MVTTKKKTTAEEAPAQEGVGPKTKAEAGTKAKITRTVMIQGETDIMFDRYAGDNDTKLEPWQKMYLGSDGKTICLPSGNIRSALSAQNTDSWPKRVLDSRKYKAFCLACTSYLQITPDMIPFTREGVPIELGKFSGDKDPTSGVYIRRDVARLEKGIPNPKVRPVLPMPWELTFTLVIFPNRYIQETQLMNVFTEGLFACGLGTWRGQFGKGSVVHWE